MAPAAFWRAWSIWVVSVAAYAAASGYSAIHPLPAKLASDVGSAADGVLGAVFIVAFATVATLEAYDAAVAKELGGPGMTGAATRPTSDIVQTINE